MKSMRAVIVLMLCCASMAFGAGQTEGANAGKDALKIAFITKSYQHSFFEYMRVAAMDMAKEKGINLSYFAPTKPYNLEEQTRLVDDAIAKGVDGILLVPVDSVGMVPAVERANKAGIPVAIVNTKLQGAKVVTFAAIENYDAMYQLTEYMMDKMGHKGRVIILEGAAGSQTAIDRLKAMQDVIAKYPDVKVLASQTANFNRADGMAVMENLLQTYPDFDAIISANFEMSLGAIEALRAANKLSGKLISGFDFMEEGVAAIKKGEATVTMDQNPQGQATQALDALVRSIKGEQVPPFIKIDGILIDKSNVDKYLK